MPNDPLTSPDRIGRPQHAELDAMRAREPSMAGTKAGTPDRILGPLGVGLMNYYVSTLVVVLSAWFAFGYGSLCQSHPGSAARVDLVSSFAAWDGEWYVKIATRGYEFEERQMSSVNFFPAYPVSAGVIRFWTGARAEWALLAVSHSALLGAFMMLAKYIAARFRESGPELWEYSLLSLGLFPTTFWMRMTYAESLLLLVLLVAMFGMERGWRPWIVAAVIGFATATRPTGVALLPVFWWWLWREREPRSFLRAAGAAAALLPLTLWGLLAYMAFLQYEFGEPLAFVKSQVHFSEREFGGLADKLFKLVTLEPFWAVYVPSSDCYWGRVPPYDNPLFNLRFWNPVYVLLTIGLVVLGAKKRWLNSREVLLAAALLAIPLWFQACRNCMMSHARFASVVFPMYIVMGQILSRLPPPLVALLSAMSGVLLSIYTAMFVLWYWFY